MLPPYIQENYVMHRHNSWAGRAPAVLRFAMALSGILLCIMGFVTGSASTSMAQNAYSMQQLCQETFSPTGLNNNGEICGMSEDYHAVLWLPKPHYGLSAGLHYLGDLGFSGYTNYSLPTALNSRGDVVGVAWGVSTTSSDIGHAFKWSPQNGMVDLTPGAGSGGIGFSVAYCIDDRDDADHDSSDIYGLVAYDTTPETYVANCFETSVSFPLSLAQGNLFDIPSVVMAAPNTYHVVGSFTTDPNGASGIYGFWWDSLSLTNLSGSAKTIYPLPGYEADAVYPQSVNDKGQVVGMDIGYGWGAGAGEAWLWDATTGNLTDLGSSGARMLEEPWSTIPTPTIGTFINNNGVIVGNPAPNNTTPPNGPWVWDPTNKVQRHLNDILGLTGSPSALKWAYGLNAYGQILVESKDGYLYLLIPQVVTLKLAPPTIQQDPTTGAYTANITLNNVGNETASSVTITKATLGKSSTTTSLPLTVGDIAVGATGNATLTFPASAGTSGTTVTLKISGTSTGGAFSVSKNVTLP